MALSEYLTLTPDDALVLRRQRVRDLETQHYRLQLAAEEVDSSDGVADEQAVIEAAIALHRGVLEPPPAAPKRAARRKAGGRRASVPAVAPNEGPGVSPGTGAPLDLTETPAGDTSDTTT